MTDRFMPDWFARQDVQQFVALCEAHTIPIRFVGGCVRDTVMQRDVGDFDVCSSVTPQEMMQLLEGKARIIPTGLAHGTVTILIDHTHFEVTTLRKDVACDGRHAQVAFTDDWREDALRRDFTMNALMLAPDGTLYDYTDGLADAKAGRVRFIGDAEQRIMEDYLRILRMFRFYAWYGAAPLDETALNACQKHAEQLVNLSVERIAKEMLKLLAAPNPADALVAMQDCGVWQVITHESACDVARLEQLIKIEAQQGKKADVLLRLLCLMDDKAPIIAQHWRLSKQQQHFLQQVLSVPFLDTPHEVKKALYFHGREISYAAALWQLAQGKNARIADVRGLDIPVFPITGKDLLAEGFEAGKALGEELKRREREWIEGGFRF